jgi:flagellar biosynthesis protein FlhB
MQEQEQNRTEPATEFKLREARKRGQIAKSTDFNILVIVCGLLTAIAIWGQAQWTRLCELCARLFAGAATFQVDVDGTTHLGEILTREALTALLPFAATGFAFAIVANVVQTGPILSGEPIKPKFERLNPVAGFKRLFNKRVLFEALKSVLKLGFFAAIAYGFFVSLWPGLTTLAAGGLAAQMQWLGSSAVGLLFRLGLALAVVGLLDLLYVRWSYGRDMMMSRRELKEEIKRREGDPQIRARIRELQRENLKQARSMSRVPEADVLITNPQHLAVALSYDRERMSAPVVIAKGAEAWAAEMRSIAGRHGIPRFENRRLARLLFRRAQLDQPIPPESFLDVARLYAELGKRERAEARYEVAR